MKERDFVTVYKYLDAQGGLAMLSQSNLQFTNATRKRNPEIKIYQMNTDPEAFRLKEEIIESKLWQRKQKL